jgi:type I site-specific restriction endonuclease
MAPLCIRGIETVTDSLLLPWPTVKSSTNAAAGTASTSVTTASPTPLSSSRGKMVTRGKSKFADCALYYRLNIPIAIVEARYNKHSVGDGMQRALEYAEILNIPFVFSSNGDGFVFHDRTGTSPKMKSTLALNAFPRPEALWQVYREWKGLSPEVEEIVLQDYFDVGSGREPRYYQRSAINARIEADRHWAGSTAPRHGAPASGARPTGKLAPR